MKRLSLIVVSLFVGLVVWPQSTHAIVFHGRIPPGTVKLGYDWEIEPELEVLLKTHRHVAGHFTDAPTWWDGHFSAEYLYQGREPELQKLIDDLDGLIYPHVKVVVADAEGMWDGNRVFRRSDSLPYDWSLRLAETRINDPAKFPPAGSMIVNMPTIELRIHLGDRLDHSRLRIPQRLLDSPKPGNGPIIIPVQQAADQPVDALHALARAARQD